VQNFCFLFFLILFCFANNLPMPHNLNTTLRRQFLKRPFCFSLKENFFLFSGESSVGKSSLLQRYVDGNFFCHFYFFLKIFFCLDAFQYNWIATIGIDIRLKMVPIHGKVKFVLCPISFSQFFGFFQYPPLKWSSPKRFLCLSIFLGHLFR
jgi:hypothetical protein